jgi:hypothetical protein
MIMKIFFFSLFVFINNSVFGMSYYKEIFYIENSTNGSLTFSMICNDDIEYHRNLDVYKNEIYFTTIRRLRARSNSKFPILPEGKIIIMDCQVNIHMRALEKFQRILKNFTVYDAEGNLILSMDDITCESQVLKIKR